MRGFTAGMALALVVAHPGRAQDGGADPLRAGRYDVEVRLELPHIDNLNMEKSVTVCVTPDHAGGDNRGLVVLGDNNPLARCPVSNVRRAGNVLTFDIACAGPNAARASASYLLAEESFRGRITMNMGGKNMTMAETQVGRRVGDCRDPGASSS